MLSFIILALAAFLLGSIPTGYIIGRMQGIDLRQEGSGNIGATNAKRVLGKKAGAMTLCGDLLKGVLAVMLPTLIALRGVPDEIVLQLQPVLALCAVLGHCFSPFLKMRGGKGVATGLGGFMVISPIAALAAVGIFIIVERVTRYVSLASISAVGLFPLLLLLEVKKSYGPITFLMAILTSALIVFRHRANIIRLASGEELKH